MVKLSAFGFKENRMNGSQSGVLKVKNEELNRLKMIDIISYLLCGPFLKLVALLLDLFRY